MEPNTQTSMKLVFLIHWMKIHLNLCLLLSFLYEENTKSNESLKNGSKTKGDKKEDY